MGSHRFSGLKKTHHSSSTSAFHNKALVVVEKTPERQKQTLVKKESARTHIITFVEKALLKPPVLWCNYWSGEECVGVGVGVLGGGMQSA